MSDRPTQFTLDEIWHARELVSKFDLALTHAWSGGVDVDARALRFIRAGNAARDLLNVAAKFRVDGTVFSACARLMFDNHLRARSPAGAAIPPANDSTTWDVLEARLADLRARLDEASAAWWVQASPAERIKEKDEAREVLSKAHEAATKADKEYGALVTNKMILCWRAKGVIGDFEMAVRAGVLNDEEMSRLKAQLKATMEREWYKAAIEAGWPTEKKQARCNAAAERSGEANFRQEEAEARWKEADTRCGDDGKAVGDLAGAAVGAAKGHNADGKYATPRGSAQFTLADIQQERELVSHFEASVDRLTPVVQSFIVKLCARAFCVLVRPGMSDSDAIAQRENFQRWLRMKHGVMGPSHPELVNPALQLMNYGDFLRDALAAEDASREFIEAYRIVADNAKRLLGVAAKFGVDGAVFAEYARYCADCINKVEENPVSSIYPLAEVSLDGTAMQHICDLKATPQSDLDADTPNSRFCPLATPMVNGPRLDDRLEASLAELKAWMSNPRQAVAESHTRPIPPAEGADGTEMRAGDGGNVGGKEAKPVHSSDFTMVRWYGAEYTFAKGVQSSAVKALWEEWEKSELGLHQDTIRDAIDAERDNFRMDITFRNHLAFGTMIQRCGDGKYKLARSTPKPIPDVSKPKKKRQKRA